MTIAYQYNADTNIVDTTFTGIVSAKELLEYLNGVLADEFVKPDFIEIVNMEAVQGLKVRYSETSPFEDIWSKFRDKGCAATIIYAPNDKSFRTLRMIQSVVDFKDQNTPQQFIVVRTKEEITKHLDSLRNCGLN